MDLSDRDLLAAFVQHRDERAFAALVQRYAGLVFGAALRRTGDRGLAEEVAQNVFALLARKAIALTAHPALAAWLQKTAAYESIRAAEKDANRRRRMHELQQEPHSAGADPAGHWDHVLPRLDGAIASLPERDRQALLLRYWSGQSYKAIAERDGSSPDACEKRVGRALEKLSRLLGRRGATVSAAALAAGLLPSLTKAAVPPHLAAAWAGAAAARSGASAAAGAILLTMKTKSILTGAAVLGLLLCGATGWQASRSTATAARSTGQSRAGGTAENSTTAAAAGSESARQKISGLRALLEQARAEFRAAEYGLAEAGVRAELRIASIPQEDIPAALEILRSLPGGLSGQAGLTGAILARWALHDGPAACEFAVREVKTPDIGIPAIRWPLTAWAQRDPAAAWQWLESRSRAATEPPVDPAARSEWTPVSGSRWIFGPWAMQDPAGAAAALRTLTDPAQRSGAVTGLTELAAAAPQRGLLLDALFPPGEVLDGSGSGHQLAGMLQSWARENPAELASWIAQRKIEKSYDWLMTSGILKGWLQADPSAAVDWWMSRPSPWPEKPQRLASLMEAWGQENAFAAAEWLSAQPRDQESYAAVASLSEQAAREDPERAWAWALTLPPDWPRKDVLTRVAALWNHKEAEAAREAFSAAALSDEERAAIRIAIEPPSPPSR